MGKNDNRWMRKVLSILLSAVMVLSYSSASTFALFAGEAETDPAAEVTTEQETPAAPESEEVTEEQEQPAAPAENTGDEEKPAAEPEQQVVLDEDVQTDTVRKEENKADKNKLPPLKAKYTMPLSDDQIDEDTPIRAGIMKKALKAKASVSDGTIKNYMAELFYGGTEEDGKYVWHAQSSAKDHRFSIRYSFTLGSEDEEGIYKGSVDDAGDSAGVHLVVPANIIKDRNGDYADHIDMSIPSREDVLESMESGEALDGDMSFAWYQEGNNIVIYNFRDIEQGFDGFIEMSYLTNEKTFSYEDMSESDLITSIMTAKLDGSSSESRVESEAGPVVIDTQVELLSMESRIPSQYASWQGAWGDAAAADIENPGDYIYMRYEVRSRINDNSEMYDFSISDDFLNLAAKDENGQSYSTEDIKGHLKVVGVKFSGKDGLVTPDTDGKCTVENQTANGYRSDYIVVALEKSFFDTMNYYEITTNTTVTVHPVDGKDEDSTASYKRKYVYNKPTFPGSGGGVGSYKRADGFYRYAIENDKQTTYWTGLGMNAGYYSRYDLQEFIDAAAKGETYRLDDLDYAVGTNARPGKWTMDPGYAAEGKTAETTEDWEKYYRKPVKIETIDDQFFVLDEQDAKLVSHTDPDHKLVAGDYQIDSIALGFNSYDRAYNPATAAFDKKVGIKYLNDASIDGMTEPYDESVDFFVRAGSPDAEWTRAATYSMVDKKFTYKNDDLVKSTSGMKIVFNNDSEENKVYGYKFETYNVHYYTSIGTVPSISLFNTEHVLSFMHKDGESMPDGSTYSPTESIALYNSALTNAYDYRSEAEAAKEPTGEESEEPYSHCVSRGKVGSNVMTDADFIRVVQKESKLDKNVVATANSPRKKQYSVSWQIDMSEIITADADGTMNVITQNGGVFYDLLPAGSSVDTDTIAVSNQDGELRSSNYSYEIKQDYKDGRTLLIVRIKEPGDSYTLTYDTIHPYESLRDYGNNVYNPIAYETGNSNIYFGTTNSNPDKKLVGTKDEDGNYETMKEADLMTDLPSSADPDAEKFIYQERKYDIGAITAAASGLSKKVLTDRNNTYSGSGITANNSTYSYRLRYQNSYANEAGDLIIYDALDSFNGGGDWKGTLQSIDLSLIKEKGIDPKVYISTTENLDIPANKDLSSSVWEEVDPADSAKLSKAKAIAIDMTMAANPENPDEPYFVLGKGDAVTAYLYMKAPEGAERKDGKDGYPEAWNNVYIQTAPHTETETGEPKLYNYDYTITKLVIYGDVNVKKVSPEGDPIRNIKFRLYGTSDYGTDVDQYEISDKSGYLTFKNIEKGSYKLVEYEGTPDWLEDHTEHDVVIDGKGKVKIDGTDYTEEEFTVENEPRIHADISFLKIRQRPEGDERLVRIEGVKFLLKGESDYGNDVIKDAVSGADGSVTFTDVEKGTYEVYEIETNDEYLLSKEVYRAVVDAEGNYTLYTKNESGDYVEVEDSKGTDLVSNVPKYWDVEFIKIDKDLPARTLQGAEFQLSGENIEITEENPEGILTAVSNEAGRVEFKHLKAGTYLLKETKAPTNVDIEGKTRPEDQEDDGTYTLNYALDETEHILTIEEDGTYTIDGLEKNDKDTYVFPDERALDGQITVIKKWEDVDDSKRELPKVHLKTSEEYNTVKGLTVTVEWIGDYAAARPSDLDVTVLKNGDEYDGEPKVTAKGNIWTYYYPDFEYKGSDTVKVYEEQPESTNDNGEYTGSAVGVDKAVAVVSGKAVITNTLALKYNYGFTGEVQTFTAPTDGWYQFEAWGAQGGCGVTNTYAGSTSKGKATNATTGQGAYTSGKVYLEAGKTIYVYVGQGGQQSASYTSYWSSSTPIEKVRTNAAWNGGGRGEHDHSDDDGAGGGGGATDFRLTKDSNGDDSWNSASSLASRIMVAAGGSGANDGFTGSPGGTLSTRLQRDRGSRQMILSVNQSGNASEDNSNRTAMAGAGYDGYVSSRYGTNAYAYNASSNNPWDGMPGAGGGYYGGTVGHIDNGDTSEGYALGGVSYISGYDGCEALEDLKFTAGYMEAGSESVLNNIPAEYKVLAYKTYKTPRGNQDAMAGYNGYARVTFLSQDSPDAPEAPEPTQTGGTATDEYVTTDTGADVDAEGGWEKVDDNTWKYVVNVFNDNAVYDVWEETIPGYTSEQYGSADKPALQLDGSESKTVTVTNKADAAFGELKVGKTVSGYTTSQKFPITVELTGDNIPDGNKVFNVTIGNSTNGVVFTDGKGVIRLAHGETAVIKDVPVGTSYKVTEADNESFKATYANRSGTIAEDSGSLATVTNTYTEPEVGKANITVAKKVTGAADASDTDREYPFIVMLTNLAPELEYTYTIGEESTTFASDTEGKATLSFNLKADENAVINGVPVGTGYQVTESAGDYISSYKLTDAAGVSEFSKTAGENTSSNTALTTGEETVDSVKTDDGKKAEDVTVTFTNKLAGTQKLTVAKKVDKNGYDCSDNDEFPITITISGLDPGAIISASNGKWKADDMGTAEKTVSLKDGQSVEFRDIPVGAQYQITEEKNAYVASYEITGDTDPNNDVAEFVKDKDTNKDDDPKNDPDNKKKLSTALETVNRHENATVTFTNTYEAVGTIATTDMASKTVLHMQPGMGEDGVTFNFDIEAVSGTQGTEEIAKADVPMPADKDGNTVTEASLKFTEAGSADIDFGNITYTRPGTYVYKVTEDKKGLSDRWLDPVYMMTGDDKTITVNVTDNHDGTLTAAPVLKGIIVNDYKTDLVIRKTLDEFMMHELTSGNIDASFVFIITGKDENGEVKYRNTAGIQYSADSPATQEVTIRDIPFDLNVTVEEADDLNYKHVGEYKDVPMVLQTDGSYKELFLTEFKNNVDDPENISPEGGIVNSFDKSEDGYVYRSPASGDAD